MSIILLTEIFFHKFTNNVRMRSPRLVMSFAVAYMYNDTEPRVGWSGSDNNPSVQIFQRVLNPTDLQFSVTSSEGEVMQWPQCTNVAIQIF